MFVTYFDEVKANPTNGQNIYFVGGIAVPVTEIGRMEFAVTELANELFGSSVLLQVGQLIEQEWRYDLQQAFL